MAVVLSRWSQLTNREGEGVQPGGKLLSDLSPLESTALCCAIYFRYNTENHSTK